MKKSPIRVGCVLHGRDPHVRNEIEKALSSLMEEYGAIYDHDNPDILFFETCNTGRFLNYSRDATIMVGWYEENIYPNFNIAHYSISHVRSSCGGRNFYSPGYVYSTLRDADVLPSAGMEEERSFAIFIASQDNTGYGASLRRQFVEYVQKRYKRVDCPGKVLHNVDMRKELGDRFCKDWQARKQRVLSRYKFVISFENTNTDGYMTEKLVDAFLSRTIPIYWGSEGNLAPFPKEAVICANDYESFDSLLARIKQVDQDKELYRKILAASPLNCPGARERIMAQHEVEKTAFLRGIFEKAQARKHAPNSSPFRHADLSVSPSGYGVTFDSYTRALRRFACREFDSRGLQWWREAVHFYPFRGRFYSEKRSCPIADFFHKDQIQANCPLGVTSTAKKV